MAVFVNNITSSSTMADVAAQLDTWAAQMAQLTVADNFTGSFAANISDITNGLSALGGTLSGNLACDSGVLVDGVDVSELGTKVETIQTTVSNDVVSKTDIVIIDNYIASDGENLYNVFMSQTGGSTSTHNIFYSITGFKFTPLDNTHKQYTLGNIEAYMDGSVVRISGIDREGNSILPPDLVAYCRILAIPK